MPLRTIVTVSALGIAILGLFPATLIIAYRMGYNGAYDTASANFQVALTEQIIGQIHEREAEVEQATSLYKKTYGNHLENCRHELIRVKQVYYLRSQLTKDEGND